MNNFLSLKRNIKYYIIIRIYGESLNHKEIILEKRRVFSFKVDKYPF